MARAGSTSLTAKVVGYGEGGVNVAGKMSAKEHAAFARAEFCDAPLHLRVELPHEALNGPRRCVALGVAFDLLLQGCGAVRWAS